MDSVVATAAIVVPFVAIKAPPELVTIEYCVPLDLPYFFGHMALRADFI